MSTTISGGELERQFTGAFVAVMQRVMPPDIRMWVSDYLKFELSTDPARMTTMYRMGFYPRDMVVPKTPIVLQVEVQDFPNIDVVMSMRDRYGHEMEDFVLKIMMVYSINEPTRPM